MYRFVQKQIHSGNKLVAFFMGELLSIHLILKFLICNYFVGGAKIYK